MGKPSNHVNYDKDFETFVTGEVGNMCNNRSEKDRCVLSDAIDVNEVQEVCKNLKTGKAQDRRGLSYEHFKYAGRNVFLILTMLFNSIICSEVLPKDFTRSITIPLFKGGKKDPLDKDDYRGITIQSVICKSFDTIIMNRSFNLIREKFAICHSQFACHKGLSSVNASLTLQESVSHLVQKGENVYATFFDTRKAFDTVWIDGLFYVLYQKGIRGKLWRLLKYAYLNSITSVLINGNFSEWFRLLQGVKQGAVLSMLLYICFINLLITEVLSTGIGCEVLSMSMGCIGYADDIVFLTTNQLAMQELINLAFDSSCRWRYEFNVKKCASLTFGTPCEQETL